MKAHFYRLTNPFKLKTYHERPPHIWVLSSLRIKTAASYQSGNVVYRCLILTVHSMVQYSKFRTFVWFRTVRGHRSTGEAAEWDERQPRLSSQKREPTPHATNTQTVPVLFQVWITNKILSESHISTTRWELHQSIAEVSLDLRVKVWNVTTEGQIKKGKNK